MARFIPVNEEKANGLREALAKTLFRDPETFVHAYNSGFIAKGNPELKELTRQIVETFKDVCEKRGKLQFISEAEIAINEASDRLQVWATLVRVKRELGEMLREGVVKENSLIAVNSEGLAAIVTTVEGEDGEPVENFEVLETFDKVKASELSHLLRIPNARYADENYVFLVGNVLRLDDSFINGLNVIPHI